MDTPRTHRLLGQCMIRIRHIASIQAPGYLFLHIVWLVKVNSAMMALPSTNIALNLPEATTKGLLIVGIIMIVKPIVHNFSDHIKVLEYLQEAAKHHSNYL